MRRLGDRVSISNYTATEIEVMFYIETEIEPLGADEGSLVETQFQQRGMAYASTSRDTEFLKKKFDKLLSRRKKTGDLP